MDPETFQVHNSRFHPKRLSACAWRKRCDFSWSPTLCQLGPLKFYTPNLQVATCKKLLLHITYHYATYFNWQLNWKFFDPKNLGIYVLMLAPKSWNISHHTCRCIPCGTVKLRSLRGCREWIKGLNKLQRNIRTSSPKHILPLEWKSAPTMGVYVLVAVKIIDVCYNVYNIIKSPTM